MNNSELGSEVAVLYDLLKSRKETIEHYYASSNYRSYTEQQELVVQEIAKYDSRIGASLRRIVNGIRLG